MPTSIVVAVASTVVSEMVVGYVATNFMISMAARTVIGAVAGALTSGLLNSALSGSDDPTSPEAQITTQDRTVTVRQPISPWQYIYGETRVGGTITYMESVGANEYLHIVVTFAGHVSDSIETIYLGEDALTLDGDGNGTGRWDGYVYATKSTGAESGQPFPVLAAASAGQWSDAHRQTGRTKLHLRLRWSQDVFPTGLPNISCKIRGKKVYDPRSGLTAWSDNPALIVADYLCDTAIGMGVDYDTEIDETLLIAAANVCDEPVTLADGTTEARYTCNGVALSSSSPESVIEALLTSMAGTAVFVGGQWHIYAGAYRTPTVTLTESDFRGPVRVQTMTSRRDNFNAVKGVFVSPDNFWVPTDFPPVTNTTYETQDGERVWQDIRLPYTDSVTMSQRLAKIALERGRQPITVVCPLKLSSYALVPPDTVMLTMSKFGWTSKVFEVQSSALTSEGDGPVLGVDLVLREVTSSAYTWSASEEGDFDTAPNSTLPDPFSPPTPGFPTVTEELYETTGSAGAKARAIVSVAETDTMAVDWLFEYKAVADSTYTTIPSTRSSTAHVDDIAPGAYHFRVRTVNSIGVRSDYGGPTRAEIFGLTTAPDDVESFSVVASAGFALARWTRHDDLDVRLGGRIVVRHSPQTSAVGWNDGVIVGEFTGDSIQGFVPLVTGTYFAKAVDSSDHWSTTAASFVLTEGMVTGLSTIASVTEDPGFTGTKTNCAVSGGVLSISSSVLIDSVAGNVDDYPDWDSAGGQSLTAEYLFANVLDCTTVAVRRFEADLDARAINNDDMWDSRLGMIDDWPGLIDGDVIEGWTVTLSAAITDDDPAGAPTWSSWRPFHVADFNCRAAKFKADLVVANAGHNIEIATLRVAAKA